MDYIARNYGEYLMNQGTRDGFAIHPLPKGRGLLARQDKIDNELVSCYLKKESFLKFDFHADTPEPLISKIRDSYAESGWNATIEWTDSRAESSVGIYNNKKSLLLSIDTNSSDKAEKPILNVLDFIKRSGIKLYPWQTIFLKSVYCGRKHSEDLGLSVNEIRRIITDTGTGGFGTVGENTQDQLIHFTALYKDNPITDVHATLGRRSGTTFLMNLISCYEIYLLLECENENKHVFSSEKEHINTIVDVLCITGSSNIAEYTKSCFCDLIKICLPNSLYSQSGNRVIIYHSKTSIRYIASSICDSSGLIGLSPKVVFLDSVSLDTIRSIRSLSLDDASLQYNDDALRIAFSHYDIDCIPRFYVRKPLDLQISTWLMNKSVTAEELIRCEQELGNKEFLYQFGAKRR